MKGLILLAILLLTGNLAAATQTQNLIELYELAKNRDSVYLASAAQLQADLEISNQAFAALLPNLNFNAQIEQQNNNSHDAGGLPVNTHRNPTTYSLNLNQALFQPQIWQNYKQGQWTTEAAKLRFRQAEQDLILRLTRAYFDLLSAQDDLSNLHAQKIATAEQLTFAKRSFEAGNSTITDQQEAQARFDLITAQELAAKNQLAIANLQIETISGIPVETPAKLREEIQLTPLSPNNLQAWADHASIDNLQAQQAQLAQLIAKAEVKKAQLGHLPTIDLTAQLVETEQQLFDSNNRRPFDLAVNSTTISLVMNLPIFTGGGTQSKVRQQAAMLEKSRLEFDLARKNASQQAKATFLSAQTNLSQVEALQTAVSSSKLALQSNKTAYEVGIRINLDVLNAQQQFNSTQRDLSKAKYNSLIKMLELQALVGQLNEKALQEVNNLLVD
jgi:outer membrane protein